MGHKRVMPGQAARVVVAGAGVAGLEVLLGLRELAGEQVALELVEPRARFSYRPLAVAAALGLGKVARLDVKTIASDLGAVHRADSLVAVLPDAKKAVLASGTLLAYDALAITAGAAPEPALPGAITFGGEHDAAQLRDLLADVEAGTVRDLVFVAPGGTAWPFALYELALLVAARLDRSDVWLSLVSAEQAPLAHFGAEASATVAELLEQRGITFVGGSYPVRVESKTLVLAPSGSIPADRVVALARLRAPALGGLPVDRDGFLPTDLHGRVRGLADVYAAGDITSFPLKQGGIAVQQAAAVAESIAASLGALASPKPFRPVLRGRLLTGAAPQYLRAAVSGGAGETSAAGTAPLWWPPSKIAGGRLAAYLAARGVPVADAPAGATLGAVAR